MSTWRRRRGGEEDGCERLRRVPCPRPAPHCPYRRAGRQRRRRAARPLPTAPARQPLPRAEAACSGGSAEQKRRPRPRRQLTTAARQRCSWGSCRPAGDAALREALATAAHKTAGWTSQSSRQRRRQAPGSGAAKPAAQRAAAAAARSAGASRDESAAESGRCALPAIGCCRRRVAAHARCTARCAPAAGAPLRRCRAADACALPMPAG